MTLLYLLFLEFRIQILYTDFTINVLLLLFVSEKNYCFVERIRRIRDQRYFTIEGGIERERERERLFII